MNTFTTLALIASDHRDRWGDDWNGPPWPLLPIVTILVIAAIWLLVVRRWWRTPRVSGESVLAERYARGEIDESEYRARRDVLRRRN